MPESGTRVSPAWRGGPSPVPSLPNSDSHHGPVSGDRPGDNGSGLLSGLKQHTTGVSRARLFPDIATHCPRPRGGGGGARSAGGVGGCRRAAYGYPSRWEARGVRPLGVPGVRVSQGGGGRKRSSRSLRASAAPPAGAPPRGKKERVDQFPLACLRSSWSRRMLRWIFPDMVFGSSGTNSIDLGYLYGAVVFRT